MTSKECRACFNHMIQNMQENPADPAVMHVSVTMFQMQAMWEVAAQLAEMNERLAAGTPARAAIQ